jgi:hypothetical protein
LEIGICVSDASGLHPFLKLKQALQSGQNKHLVSNEFVSKSKHEQYYSVKDKLYQ